MRKQDKPLSMTDQIKINSGLQDKLQEWKDAPRTDKFADRLFLRIRGCYGPELPLNWLVNDAIETILKEQPELKNERTALINLASTNIANYLQENDILRRAPEKQEFAELLINTSHISAINKVLLNKYFGLNGETPLTIKEINAQYQPGKYRLTKKHIENELNKGLRSLRYNPVVKEVIIQYMGLITPTMAKQGIEKINLLQEELTREKTTSVYDSASLSPIEVQMSYNEGTGFQISDDLKSIKIKDLHSLIEITPRLHNILIGNGLKTLGDLDAKTLHDFYKLRSFGNKSYEEIKALPEQITKNAEKITEYVTSTRGYNTQS